MSRPEASRANARVLLSPTAQTARTDPSKGSVSSSQSDVPVSSKGQPRRTLPRGSSKAEDGALVRGDRHEQASAWAGARAAVTEAASA